MAAYAALVSLMQIIHQIEHHPFPPISMEKRQVESLTEIVTFLQEFLKGYKSPFADGDEADPLEMRIADAVYAAEDVIESHIVDQILPTASEVKRDWIGIFNCFRGLNEPENNGPMSADLHESLQKVIEGMVLIKKEVMEIGALKDQMRRQVSASAGSSTSSKMLMNNSSTYSLSNLNSTSTGTVGFDDAMLELMDKLTDGRLGRQVIPIVGMAGIGKTTLARNVYAHPLIRHHFDICAWLTISQQYKTEELLYEILSQANKEVLSEMREDEIGVALHKCLSCIRFFIVLDDMWSVEAWEKIQLYFPDNCNGNRILVTTRLSNLGSQLGNNYSHEMKFMNEESSWNLLTEIVFGGKSWPLELEKIGKKIVSSCKGLPLSIVVMRGLLKKMERTKECWESIMRSTSSLVNSENDNRCLKILKLSYNHLPVYLKPCFLYLGMFEEDSEIRVSIVIKLWVSEGFLKPISGKSLETIAKEYIDELVDRKLILVHELGSTGSMKYLKIHDLLRDLCLREAQKERFYDAVGKHSPQGMYSQRRVVILRSTPEEKVIDAMKSRPYARTCICDGEKIMYVPDFRLLRILKAHNKDFYPQGHEYSLRKLFELVNLRLLIVKSDWYPQFPSSINLLWSLQTLIVCGSIGSLNAPVEIWSMPQLRHVHFWRRALNLRDTPSDSIVNMENLQTLKGVKNFKCDEVMVRRISNIKKLGLYYYINVRIESRDDDYCVHNIEHLQKLESFQCKGYAKSDLLGKLTFPLSLKSLTLDFKHYSMEDMLEKVSTLPFLQKLKLSDGRFTTKKWETVEDKFPSLKYLLLGSCSGLECWVMESSHFPCLEHLYLYKMSLKEIPAELGEIPTLKSVILDNCSESAVKSAKRMVEEQEELQGEEQLSFKVEIRLRRKKEELQRLANPNFQVNTDW